jgi:hypothetical protein
LLNRKNTQGKKRLREHGDDAHTPNCSTQLDYERDDGDVVAIIDSLVLILKDLMKALEASIGTGTPAVHMYSILDQVAAVRHEIGSEHTQSVSTSLLEVDSLLIYLLKHCKDDGMRKKV